MRSCRVTLTWLVVLAAMVLSVPASAIAGGPSAGDNQYTDPLAGNHNGSGSHTTTTSSPTTSTSTPTPTGSSSSGASTTPLSSASPTATTASSTSTSTGSAASSRTLPRTGFDAGLGALIGASLIGVGLVTRRRISSSTR